jgi:NADPH:quinone reductase and related Zn-dependent oxidoreductases
MTETMIQSILVHQYGGPDQLKLAQTQRPTPQAGEVLVHVYAAGVNPVDWKIRRGDFRSFGPQHFPYIPGSDIAGIVEEVGPGVTAFQPGQAVFGQSNIGAYTEYATASVEALAAKPENVSFAEAAAIPIGATTAWQTLFDAGKLQAGQRVLIQGASGGVGLFAVQFAHLKGAYVIGTTSSQHVDYVRQLGVDTVIDYKSTPIESVVSDVDLVLDTVGGATLEKSYSLVKRGGTLVTIAGMPDEAKAQQLGIHATFISAKTSSQLLQQFAQLVSKGQVKVTIEDTYPLSAAEQAQRQSESGHGLGRIILHIAD